MKVLVFVLTTAPASIPFIYSVTVPDVDGGVMSEPLSAQLAVEVETQLSYE